VEAAGDPDALKPVLHIVTQCTDRKKVAAPRELQLHRFGGRDLSRRADAWLEALDEQPAATTLRDLYAGEHWVTSLELEQLAADQGFESRMWVVSAGLGIVSVDTNAPSYSATFASNVDDTVLVDADDPAQQRRLWLEKLTTRPGSKTLLGLCDGPSNAYFLCVLSRPYVQAALRDLEATQRRLKDPNRLMVVTADAPELASGPLSKSWVPSSSRFQHIVGGTRIGQHARVAKKLLTSGQVGAESWRKRTQRWLAEAPAPTVFDRTPMSDLQVRLFAKLTPHGSWSRALRALREEGNACEQKRFRRLFKEERET
jgi:hypothetical protein